MSILKTVPVNTAGRDFVVGDLHGCFDQFQMFLNFINFDPSVDRVFSVGDLVDRGPKNWQCLNLLNEPWFHAVKGNHEDMMAGYLGGWDKGNHGSAWPMNGGLWNEDECLDLSELGAWVDTIASMPVVITVPGEFHVLHADLWDDGTPITNDKLTDVFKVQRMTLRTLGRREQIGLWGRDRFGYIGTSDPSPQTIAEVIDQCADVNNDDLWPIFVGHTPMNQPTRLGKLFNIDTMAFAVGKRPWCGLTFAEPRTGKFWKVTDDISEQKLRVFL